MASTATMAHRQSNMPTSEDRKRPGFMSSSQKAEYLKDLRKSVPRPSGSRPAPVSKYGSLRRTDTDISAHKSMNVTKPDLTHSNSMPVQSLPHRKSSSHIPSAFQGRPLVRPPSSTDSQSSNEEKNVLKKRASIQYLENGTRWMEKQETRSLRRAMNDMDLACEKKLHDAAQDEAAELVWKHQNPDAVYKNPEYKNPDYKSHLRNGSYHVSHGTSPAPMVVSRSSSGSSQHAPIKDIAESEASSKTKSRSVSSSKPYGDLADQVRKDVEVSKRRISSGARRLLSGEKKRFMHPDDKIWEDKEPSTMQNKMIPNLRPSIAPTTPAYVRKNPFARVRMQHDKLERSTSAPTLQPVRHNSIDIQFNPPTQSRNAEYSLSESLLPDVARISLDGVRRDSQDSDREIRGDDIRAATSKLRRDRSPRLPQPTMVSDKLGRPIVSFKEPVKQELVLQEAREEDIMPSKKSTSMPAIPVINRPDDDTPAQTPVVPSIPTIVLPDEPDFATAEEIDVPAISISVPSITVQATEVKIPPQRPLPSARRSQPVMKSTPHYSPSIRASGILCAHCALPIAGRILSAAGQRFHPGCFQCQQCHTNLELVAFYPEPENKRAERIARIHARQYGELIDGMTEQQLMDQEVDDGDETLRFYCHLDFHELFSPRCKSCKTPIEGEVVLACGAEWHVGHFFCAQCGDPFESNTPFVEKEGYAWCVGCHTNRYSSKCKKCRKPVIDLVVKALGSDWHSNCFRCHECNREFDDGRYFLRDGSQDPVCVACEEIRLKS